MNRAGITLLASGGAIGIIALSSLVRVDPILIWNASASVPIGFYAVHDLETPNHGDLVVLDPPPALSNWLLKNGYLGANVPLIKHVGALPGQEVCRTELTISIDNRVVGTAKSHDRFNRPLPVWQGCHKLADDQIFFLNAAEPSSLDGRYFGPLPADTIIGRVVPIWTRRG